MTRAAGVRSRRIHGDFQTPAGLVAQVLRTLAPIASRWPRVLEPTCGQGRFLEGLLDLSSAPIEIQAIEIQPEHYQLATNLAARAGPATRVVITRANLFDVALDRDLAWQTSGPLLVVGNPPWVTAGTLGQLEAPPSLQPPRRRDVGLSGLSARTGAANFDVAEAVWLKLLHELSGTDVTFALLSKTSVARRVLQATHNARRSLKQASIHTIDAAQWFNASVDACLLTLTFADQIPDRRSLSTQIPVYASLEAETPATVMGFWQNQLIADHANHHQWSFADGPSPVTWRQGIKHDAALIMELEWDLDARRWRNGSGERIDIEPEFLYPLVKAADLAAPPAARPRRALIVTQQKIGQDTTSLVKSAPRLWAYLQSNALRFQERKSTIYRDQPPFALFGIGPYTFAPYKVAISGLRKQPVFSALGLTDGKPNVVDDASYLLPCTTAEEAALLAALHNDPISLALIRSAAFITAKRPITKSLLQRINLKAIFSATDHTELLARAASILEDHLSVQPSDRLTGALERLKQGFANT